MYKNEFDKILDASHKGALSIFVGAGVSALSNAPTWKGLIDAICKELGRETKDHYSFDECLQYPQMYYYSINEDSEVYYSFVKSQIYTQDLKPNQIHRELINLSPVSLITTNYDTLLEDTAMQLCQSFKVITTDSEIPSINGDRFILKMHGDFKHNNIVLKEEDYLNYSENFKLIETLAKGLFSTNTVVFIGYGLNDYNIKLILNWTKSLLKNSFQKPFFIYTDENKLTPEELLYLESKGLSVIDCNRINPKAASFLDRYLSFFDALRKSSYFSLANKSEIGAFNYLYETLRPLDKLHAIRKSDLSSKLHSYVNVGENGVITVLKDNEKLFTKFISINKMTEKARMKCSQRIQNQYNTILSVLKKTYIGRIAISDGFKSEEIDIDMDYPFADMLCITHDYATMIKVSKERTSSLSKNYKKAFYLSRLCRYDESYFLYSKIAQKAFKSKDYLLYYLAKSNCISLKKIIGNINRKHVCYDIEAVESVAPSNSEIENLFSGLPVDFKRKYGSLKDIFGPEMLYKYSYEAFVDGQKLLNAISSGTIEFGTTSSGKVMCRINDYLHFLLGNGIIADDFSEYKNTVKNLMSTLIYKYSTQEKEILHKRPFEDFGDSKVVFDEVDFYCLTEYFSDKELLDLFYKHGVTTIVFQNISIIERTIVNTMDHYDYLLSNKGGQVELLSLQYNLKTILALARFIDISQELVERICRFILSHEFYDIRINDKIFFLDYQLRRKEKNNLSITRIVEETLVHYLDLHTQAIKNGERFELFSTNSNINYNNLADYLENDNKPYISRELSKRVNWIINNNQILFIRFIAISYWKHLLPYQKRKFTAWIKTLIREEFKFEWVKYLVFCNARIDQDIQDSLKEYLRDSIIKAGKQKEKKEVKVFPIPDPYEELELVGYWCLIDVLKPQDYNEFLGVNSSFDLYCLYEKADYKNFDVSKLINLNNYAIKQLARNKRVKMHIREAIANKLVEKKVIESDEKKLQEMLVKFFC